MKEYTISFTVKSLSTVQQLADHVQRSFSDGATHLFILSDPGQPFYQQNRRCSCGSHVFNDYALTMVKCAACSAIWPIQ